ncbi:MAG: DUF4988 domain-containing protein [Mediterranea sp.]|jgi:hypothetical protein|nr:DUF4988 domain-containing protein [Mediterranea sp.]
MATFTSCNGDDIDELKSRVSVLELAIDDIKNQLSKALMTGQSITEVQKSDDGTWTIRLSGGGEPIVISPSVGGSSRITVTITDTEAILTVDGEEYRLPLGSKVSSLVYVPEYEDGMVLIGNEPVEVKFLARPALTDLTGAQFTIAESHELQTRAADGEQFGVRGDVRIEGDYIIVPIRALGVEAAKLYAISLQLSIGGTVIGSNFFNVQISEDFSFNTEEIGGFTIKPAYNPTSVDSEGFCQMVVDGVELLTTITNFKDLFDQLPEGAEIKLASQSKQPAGDAQSKWGILNSSLQANGDWALSGKLGTSFNPAEGQAGFLINVIADDVIKAKIYVLINDPLAAVSDDVFKGSLKGLGEPHVEYGEAPLEGSGEGAPIVFEPGVNNLNLYDVIANGQLSIKHGDGGARLPEALMSYAAEDNGENIVYSDGSALVVGDLGQSLMGTVVYYNRQTSIASSQRRGWAMTDEEKKAFAGAECNGEILNGFDGLNGSTMAANGLSISSDGFFVTTAAYGGWALRTGFGIRFEYAYGTRDISDGCLCFLWINRRDCAEGVVDNPVSVSE